MKKVIVFGASGMLGWGVSNYFFQHRGDFGDLVFTVRPNKVQQFRKIFPEVTIFPYDIKDAGLLTGMDYGINCIGMINKVIGPKKLTLAWEVNTYFVERLAAEAEEKGAKILHISTDCVFSGQTGGYNESSRHEASDTYGVTKSMSEIFRPSLRTIRCSIIGPELDTQMGLMEWFLSQPLGATVPAYSDHIWNGVTTLTYAELCHAIINNDIDLPKVHHFIPAEPVTKAQLLEYLATTYNRQDIKLNVIPSPEKSDKSLSTLHPELNGELWRLMGYDTIPTISALVEKMGKFEWKKRS